MLALGWHPRHIAGLIRSKYARDFGWTQLADAILRRVPIFTRAFLPAFSSPAWTIWSISIAFRRRNKAFAHFQTAASTCFDFKRIGTLSGEHMTNWPIGLSTGCFYHQSILDCLPPIRESGFSMIEVCSSPAHLDFRDRNRSRSRGGANQELGMEAYSFHAPFAGHRHRLFR